MDFSQMGWEIWWMLLSAGVALVGFIGRQVVQFFAGAKAIVNKEADYSATQAALLPDRVENRGFKQEISRRALGTRLGTLFFWVLVVGLVAHAGFWIYAAMFMPQ